MFRDITLGQYYPADSVLHRLDPRVKLFGTFIYMASLFLCDSVATYACAIVALIILIIISKVPFGFMIRGLKSIAFLIVITILCNIFLTQGDTVVWSFWILKATKEGIILAAQMATRLVCLLLGTSLMTLTTTPNSLMDGLEKSLGFLKRFKVPVHEMAMMMSIALRFIPILVEETDKIMKAQMARGADFESGKLVQRAKALVPLLIPLFVSAFRKAGDLAVAMEARCYNGGDGRTKMKPLTYKPADNAGYIIIALYFVVLTVVKVCVG